MSWNILRGIGGEFEIGRVLNVCPTNAPLDLTDRCLGDAIFGAEPRLRKSGRSNLQNLLLSQFTATARLSSLVSAVKKLVLLVLGLRGPTEIREAIVVTVPITVSRLMAWRRGRLEKRHGDHAVNVVVFGLAGDSHVNAEIVSPWPARSQRENVSHRESCFRAFARMDAFDAPVRTRRVIRREWYRLPNFIGIVEVSHCAVLSRGGQGRALFPQRFRPAFSVRKAQLAQVRAL